MDIGMLLVLVVIGILAGVLSGLVGIGGGIIVVPILVLLLAFSQKTAQGTTLAMFLPPVGILAVINYHRAGLINWKAALLIGAGFVIGSYFGSKLAISLSDAVVRKVFAVVMLGVAIKLLLGK